DEVTLDGPTQVLWVASGALDRQTWTPQDFGLLSVPAAALRVAGPAASAARLRDFLAGQKGPVRDLILANSAAALLVAGRVSTLPAGVEQAAQAVDSGAAARLLERWGLLSHGGKRE